MKKTAPFVQAPTGPALTCQDWPQEAALRMLMNTLDPLVAEDPDHLIVSSGAGKAVRDWASYEAIIDNLKSLGSDETLLIQSGKPVYVLSTHVNAPRVLMANSLIVPAWSDDAHFRAYEAAGLTMDGQTSAGSWTYIGAQEHLHPFCEILAGLARDHFDGTLQNRLVFSAGLGGGGSALALAVVLNGGICISVEADRTHAERRLAMGYCDEILEDLEGALDHAHYAMERKTPWAIALIGNAAEVYHEILDRGLKPDLVTDLTAAHDPLYGYIPAGLSPEDATELRRNDPAAYVEWSMISMATQVEAMLEMQAQGSVVFECGNALRLQADRSEVVGAKDIPNAVATYLQPLLREGRGPFQWMALSGDPEDCQNIERALIEALPDNAALHQWLALVQAKAPSQGLPARACWLNHDERILGGRIINTLVANGTLKAPVVVCRDHMTGTAAVPDRETEHMPDGSDAIGDWPILNAMLNTASGATWVALHQGGGTGIGRSIHTTMAVVADGSAKAAERMERVLTSEGKLTTERFMDAEQ